MAYKVIILYRLYMPSYFLGTFTEYPFIWVSVSDFICHIPGETLEHGFYPEMKHRCAFSQKRICIYQKSASSIYYVSGTKNS